MKHLEKLEVTRRVVGVPTSRRTVDNVEYRRKKLIADLEEQIELAQLGMAGKPMRLKRKRGHETVNVRPRLWWHVGEGQHVSTQILYKKKALNIDRRGRTIEVGPMRKLIPVYRTVIRATKAGELDAALALAALKK